MYLNRHDIIGRVGSDPLVKDISSGKQVILNVATNLTYPKDGEKVEITDWHKVVFYGKLADICESLVVKGSLVYVSGRHQMKKIMKQDENGIEKPFVLSEIIGQQLIILSHKDDKAKQQSFITPNKSKYSSKVPF